MFGWRGNTIHADILRCGCGHCIRRLRWHRVTVARAWHQELSIYARSRGHSAHRLPRLEVVVAVFRKPPSWRRRRCVRRRVTHDAKAAHPLRSIAQGLWRPGERAPAVQQPVRLRHRHAPGREGWRESPPEFADGSSHCWSAGHAGVSSQGFPLSASTLVRLCLVAICNAGLLS